MNIWNKIKSWFGSEEKVILYGNPPGHAEDVESEPIIVESKSPELSNSEEESKFEWPDFDKMTKLEIDVYARDEFDIHLDRRFKKETMIQTLKTKFDKTYK